MHEDEKEDEIEVDFSKIKGMFSRKKKAEVNKEPAKEHKDKPQHPKKEESEDDVEIDFGKIKGLFSGTKKESPVQEPHADEHKDKPQHPKKEESEHPEEEEKEIEISVAGIKEKFRSMFSGDKRETADDDVQVDVKKIVAWSRSHAQLLIVVFSILAVVWISSSLRLQPMDLPVANDVWAPQSIYNTIQQDVNAGIQQQYPQLPDAQRQQIIGEELQRVDRTREYTFKAGQYAGTTVNVDDQIQRTAEQFKEYFRGEDGKLYMPDIDTYYWYRYARNILEKGHIGDEVRDSKQWDTYQVAPQGREISGADKFNPYFIAYFYKFLSIIIPGISLMWAMMWYPVVASAASVAIIFLIARRIAGNVAGFFAGAMAAINASFLTRTFFGHADTDAWVVFFSVAVLWFVIEAFEAKHARTTILFGTLAGLMAGLYSAAWGGWWYVFDLLLAGIGLYIGYIILARYQSVLKKGVRVLVEDKAIRQAVLVTAVFLIASGVFVTMFTNFLNFYASPISPISTFAEFKTPVLSNLWPNVLTTVAELNPGSINQAITATGPQIITLRFINFPIPLLFVVSLIGIGATLMKTRKPNRIDAAYIAVAAVYWIIISGLALKEQITGLLLFLSLMALPLVARIGLAFFYETEEQRKSIDIKHAAILIIWFMITIMATTRGIRFTLLLVPAYSVAFGVAVGVFHKFASSFFSRTLGVNKGFAMLLIFLVPLSLFAYPDNLYAQSKSIARQDIPIINDAWWYSLDNIKQNTDQNAIISSWWDFGHHFKAIADRAVTFDGTTQQTPQAHWIGKVLSTDDEELAVGIIRMLNCGGNTAFDTLNAEVKDTVRSIDLLNAMFKMTPEEGRAYLQEQGVTNATIEKIMPLLYCNPPESVFIASEDMIGKAGVWAHFGAWDFKRAEIVKRTADMNQADAVAYMQERFGYDEKTATGLYYEVQGITDDRQENSWVAPWPGYSGSLNRCAQEGMLLQCSDGLQVNLTTMDAYFETTTGKLHPASFYYFDREGGAIKKEYTENVIPNYLSSVVYPGGSDYVSLLASPEIAGGMFTRMFFVEGGGLNYFRMLSHEISLTQQDIYVYVLEWENGKPIPAAEVRAREQAEAQAQAAVAAGE